jgi:hypothetical protein
MTKALTQEQKEENLKKQKKRTYQRLYSRMYRARNLEYIRDYQKQWERDNRSVSARRRGVSKKKGVVNFEVKHSEEGKPFIVTFD